MTGAMALAQKRNVHVIQIFGATHLSGRKTRRTVPWKYETQSVRHDRFSAFLQTELAPNLTSQRTCAACLPKDFYEWVEYCNSPAGTTTPADMRAEDGDREPFERSLLGCRQRVVGLRRQLYSGRIRGRISTLHSLGAEVTESSLAFIGSGPNGGDLDWTRRFFTKLNERRALGSMWGWALHHYSWNVSGGRTNDWFQGKGDAVKYPGGRMVRALERSGSNGLADHESLERDG